MPEGGHCQQMLGCDISVICHLRDVSREEGTLDERVGCAY
jgi:hypothetical protein